MSRNLGNQIMNNLVGGLITEVGALNFPPGGATATENCIWTQKKTVKRRLGFNFEVDFTPQTVSPPPVPPDTRFWTDIGITQDGSKVIITDGTDIYLSLDSGVTFHRAVTGGLPHGGISGVDISPDGSIIAACSFSTQGVYSSIDFGATWQTISLTGGSPPGVKIWQDISFSQIGSPVLIATEESTGDNWFYNFSGNLWSNLGDNGLGAVAVRIFYSANSPIIFGATFTDIGIVSPDSGVTWTSNENPTYISTWGAVSSNGSHIAYVGDAFSNQQWVYTSTDSGVTWTLTEPIPLIPLGICSDTDTGNILYAGDAPNGLDQGNIWKSTNQGATWTRLLSSPFIPSQIPDCSSDGSKVITISAANGVWYSHDAGDTWSQSAILP